SAGGPAFRRATKSLHSSRGRATARSRARSKLPYRRRSDGIEQMRLAQIERETVRRAVAGAGFGFDSRHEFLLADRTIEEDLVAHHLDDVDGGIETAFGRVFRMQVGVVDILGTQAQHDFPVDPRAKFGVPRPTRRKRQPKALA